MKTCDTNEIRAEIKGKCAKILFWMIVIAVFEQTTLFRVLEQDLLDWFAFLPEAACVVAIYYIYFFWHAKKGILLGVDTEASALRAFPALRDAKAALINSGLLTVAALTGRVLIGLIFIPYDVVPTLILFAVIYAVMILGAFVLFYLNFFIAYRIARRYAVQGE